MSQVCTLLKKSINQRKNMWISSIICELLFPSLILLILLIIKLIVKDEIIFNDYYPKGIRNYGPICSFCNQQYLQKYPEYINQLLKKLNIKDFYNKVRMCQISNDSLIGFIGNFSQFQNGKDILSIFFKQQFPYDVGGKINNFTFKLKDFKDNDEFENYINDPNYKKNNVPSQMKDGICLGIEVSLFKNVVISTFRFSDDFLIKDYFNLSKIILKP